MGWIRLAFNWEVHNQQFADHKAWLSIQLGNVYSRLRFPGKRAHTRSHRGHSGTALAQHYSGVASSHRTTRLYLRTARHGYDGKLTSQFMRYSI